MATNIIPADSMEKETEEESRVAFFEQCSVLRYDSYGQSRTPALALTIQRDSHVDLLVEFSRTARTGDKAVLDPDGEDAAHHR